MNFTALSAEFAAIKSAFTAGSITPEQTERLKALPAELKAASDEIAAIKAGEAALSGIKAAGPAEPAADAAHSLGEHFVKSLKDGRVPAKSEATEFKAIGDPTLVGDSQINDQDRSIVSNTRIAPSVQGLLTQGNIGGNGVVYRVELPVQGTIKAVLEGEAKAQVTYTYEEKREGISTIAGVTELSDDMREDLEYVASEINGNLVVDLAIEVDRQILDGDGVGPNLLGLLRRSGLQTLAATNTTDNVDALHRAATLGAIASGRQATAMVIHPLDFERIALSKDKNGAYLGAGPFVATISNSVWSIPAVVTTAIAQGTALVGAFTTATFLRKGGVKVKSTDSHNGNFTLGITTIVAEQRAGLKVGKPSAFVKVSFSAAAPAA